MGGCISSAIFDMQADVLRLSTDPIVTGHPNWEYQQDPISGAIKKVWVLDQDLTGSTNRIETISCTASGFISNSTNRLGTTEEYVGNIYKETDFVALTFPASVTLSRRDRITNIRMIGSTTAIWTEEETGLPTVFEVSGITPIVAPFAGHVQNYTVLQRADVQKSG